VLATPFRQQFNADALGDDSPTDYSPNFLSKEIVESGAFSSQRWSVRGVLICR
jgi:hypothetical protein